MKKTIRKNLKKLLAIVLVFALSFSCGMLSPKEVKAGAKTATKVSKKNSTKSSAKLMPTAYDNLDISLRKRSKLVNLSDGYMRVFYDNEKIKIEYYDKQFTLKSKKELGMELPLWGGFYAGSDGCYYVTLGVKNTNESDDAEVIRVIKYDKNWNRIGAASITGNTKLFGGKVRTPFDYGCVEMTEYQGNLYIVTGHEGYVDPTYKQGHQGFLMIRVNQNTMTGEIVQSDLWHSFAQYIETSDNKLYVLEQSEGSRCTILTAYDASTLDSESIEVLEYGGKHTSAWAIACYASVDDLAVSSNNILSLGTSIDQSKYESVDEKTSYNIYLAVTPKGNFNKENTKVKWLTNHENDGSSFVGTQIKKINDNRFMISWEEYGKSQSAGTSDLLESSILHYIFVDGNGEKISKEFTASAPISDCHQIVDGSKIIYYASSSNMVNFYSIDTNTGKMDKKVYRVAGEKATWDFSNGTLTISGSGAINVDTEVHYRGAVSSAKSWYSYSSTDNAWKNIRDKVKKIVIKAGITSIPDKEFTDFDNLNEVEIEEGLQSIGKEAFARCSQLKKITIPASVKSIGKSCFNTGSYWIGSGNPVINVTIYAPENSYAIKYAKENGILYQIVKKEENKTKNNKNSKSKNKKKQSVKKTKISIKLSGKKKRTIKAKWNKIAKVKGYQLQYATNKKFTKNKKTIKTKKCSVQIKKLKKGKKYFVRVRAYTTQKRKKKYTAWSKLKSLKCK